MIERTAETKKLTIDFYNNFAEIRTFLEKEITLRFSPSSLLDQILIICYYLLITKKGEKMIHLIEIEEGRPREGEMVRTKCGKELVFRPFSPSFNKMLKICVDCDTTGPTKIPNFLSVLETSLLKKTAGA